MSFAFSPETLQALTEAGWSPKRQVDTHVYAGFLKQLRFPLHESARRFLASFGGLKIEYPISHKGKVTPPRFLILDPTSNKIHRDNATQMIEFFRSEFRVDICLIGNLHHKDIDLWMSDDGRVWGTSAGILPVADSGEQAIEDILIGEKPLEYLPDEYFSMPIEERDK